MGVPGPQLFTDLAVDPARPAVLYASTEGPGGMLKSTNGDRSWNVANQGMEGGFVFDVALDPTDSSRLAAASGGIYLSTDSAETWEILGLDGEPTASLALHPADPLTLYAGVAGTDLNGGSLFKTTDGGVTWQKQVRLRTIWQTVQVIVVDPVDPDIVYAGVRTPGAILRTTNGGQTWDRVGVWGPTRSVWDLAIDPSDHSTLYAGTDAGVYVSHDYGQRWQSLAAGLFRTVVRQLAIDSNGTRLYAAVTGGGVFRYDIAQPQASIE